MLKEKVIEIFCDIDDFCKEIDECALNRSLLPDGTKRRNRKMKLSLSERMTI